LVLSAVPGARNQKAVVPSAAREDRGLLVCGLTFELSDERRQAV
jgi:hypothetical protein